MVGPVSHNPVTVTGQRASLVQLAPILQPLMEEFASSHRMILGPLRTKRDGSMTFVMSPSWLWLRRYNFEFFIGQRGFIGIRQPPNWIPPRGWATDFAQKIADVTGREVKLLVETYGGVWERWAIPGHDQVYDPHEFSRMIHSA